jgi:DNA-binding NtrC family response regulator
LGDTLLVYAPAPPSTGVAEPELVGASAAMVAVRRSVDAVAARKHMVVVTGETGTGKEVVARLVHQRSGRTGPFVAVNCGTFTEGLLASDLFGHLRGAFTGAVSEQQGLFRAARGGTLLLDEVAEIPLGLQANLLRVLEMHEVRPVGGTRDIATDVRVIATSNRELIDLVQAGLFRSDLYSRLAQWTIRLPPLRERREDIPALTSHLLARCDGLGRRLTPDLAEALLVHDWPLNVRGLLTVLSVAVVSTAGDEPLSLGPEVRLALWTTRSLAAGSEKKAEPVVLDKADLTRLMERFHGKVAAAARHLGITRPKLYRLLWAEGIKPAVFRVV